MRAIREQLHAQREQAIARWRRHQRAETLLKALSRVTDTALRATLIKHPLPSGAALGAVGGYGRGELFPYSDVDVLILLRRPASLADQEKLEHLIAALWDLGLDLSHSVRTVVECQRQAANDVTVETALMELRWVGGDAHLVSRLQAIMQRQRDPRTFFLAKRAEQQQRHARYQNTPYALEPNCKESPGGLRDLTVIQWMTQAAGIGRQWREVVAAGFLDLTEYRALRRAELAFKRLRIELHLLAGRREDRVLFDMQIRLAQVYGFESVRGRRPSELLMQRYYWAARVVSLFNRLLMQALEEHLFPAPPTALRVIDRHFKLVRNRLDIRQPEAFIQQPSLLLEAIALMQDRADLEGLTAAMMRAMWQARKRLDASFRRQPQNRHLFMRILRHPTGALTALRRMHTLGLLAHYLPEFRRIVGQMQHDLFHVYTVDEHILKVIGHLHRFATEDALHDAALAHRLLRQWPRPWLLDIAALYHDIAKGQGGDHSELGARDARRFCRQHELGAEDTELIVFLVEQHLSLSRYAQKRDLADPIVIREFADIVRTPERLTALYLLTVADIRGTSPKVWNAWKGRLIDSLYQQTSVLLGGAPMDMDTLVARHQQAATALLRADRLTEAQRDVFWAQLGTDYFMQHDASDIAWHTSHLHKCPDTPIPVACCRMLEHGEGMQVMVYAPDRADLFADICHYFAECELSVQEARIHTTRHGWALDSFIVLPVTGDAGLRSRIPSVERDLPAALMRAGEPPRPPFRARPSRRARSFPIVPRIELSANPHVEDNWRLSLVAADRRGLLYNLAQTFAQYQVDLRMAKIMTLGDRVEDSFTLHSEALQDPRRQQAFERAVLECLSSNLVN
ncbi:[protein-PII] uridylyltransferase [Pusillimonas sp. CC-YST705]|uniref:Bifunctional uridylyltransferase/uridylyl-removing enzyme n=1 Tax=Mesopusillimonas faecipullorum TaxID=2755040 RepID=A0ABS8CAR7_9BURK|nr:[protein-PII] uridylyltransferase [Mesopusillimonas faecipullorum]MCB5363123.1 [protein-PII] uridylyltransferase [Mesopusillimonas faecipullorum]